MNKIKSNDITIVIQGKILSGKFDSTVDVVKSARKYFPHAKIILSTWQNEVVSDCIFQLCDKVVFNVDPGDLTPSGNRPININRQIVSSKNGLLFADTKYAIKTRTDLLFTSDNVLNFLNMNLDRHSKFIVSKQHVLVADFTTRSHLKGLKVPFWICDFLFAGLTDDIKNIFDVDLYPECFFDFFMHNSHPHYFKDKSILYRYSPESYLAYNFLCKSNNVLFENSYDSSSLETYNDLLVNNVIVLNRYQLGVRSLKYYLPFSSYHIMSNHSEWKMLYERRFKKRIYTSKFYTYIDYVFFIFNYLFKLREK